MIKIAVFGFYCPDEYMSGDDCRSPVNTRDFMHVVREMEPAATRIGHDRDALGFVKLTGVFIQPVYVQALRDDMAASAGTLKSDGYVAIIDAVKILAPNAIRAALRRLSQLNPTADLIIAAGRQNEPEALSSDEIREVLGLSADLLIMPYVPDQPKTVHRIIRRLVRYIDNPNRVAPPFFAGDLPAVRPGTLLPAAQTTASEQAPVLPRIRGLGAITIAVSDLARSVAFYRDTLGFRLLGVVDAPTVDGRSAAHLDTGRGVIALIPVDPAPDAEAGRPTGGVQSLTLRVDALDALVVSLASAGVPVLAGPETVGAIRRAVIADPDNLHIELLEGERAYPRR